MIAEGQKKGEIATYTDGGRPSKNVSSQTTLLPRIEKPKTLTELGISRDQSSRKDRTELHKMAELEMQTILVFR